MSCSRSTESIWVLTAAVLLLSVGLRPASAQDSLRHTGGHGEGDHYEHRFDNPERFADDWNDPARDDWQKPGVVINAMSLAEGMTVADLGTGTGYFVPHLSRAVGKDGRVLAVDIELAMLRYVEKTAEKGGLENVDTVLATPTDTHLGRSAVDRVLTVNTWHHIPSREAYAEHLAERLQEGGSVWVIDFHKDAPMGPPKRHRLEPQAVVRELEAGGLDAEILDLGLPHQYVVVGRLQ
jgi:ubiquinone/menaquinone biosynthesis C-methylase UbiE